MRASTEQILMSHAGSLPRLEDLIEAKLGARSGSGGRRGRFQRKLCASVADVVRPSARSRCRHSGRRRIRQIDGPARQLRRWHSYSFHRLGGLAFDGASAYDQTPRQSRPGEVVLSNRAWFGAAYADPDSGASIGPRPAAPTCIGRLAYIGHEAIRADIANFKAALDAAGVAGRFVTPIGPASCSPHE